MSKPIRRIVIVGGGSAGWLTAGVIAAGRRSSAAGGLQVTLIESPDVATLGVGEGTWPTMRDSLRKIGLSETDFIRECDASFKQGSKFVGWVNGAADDYYYHPFVLPHRYLEADLVSGWQRGHGNNTPFAALVSFQPHLCEHGRAPKQFSTPEYAGVANYAYHLDAGKFATLLQRHCTEKLGVTHVLDHVRGIDSHPDGDIRALVTQAHGLLEGDLFVDCTGFAALLIGGHFGVPLLSRKDVLFNDTALALQVPYATADSPIASTTVATAQEAGWIWDIGLPTRRGVGYVYSSRHSSEEQARRTLAKYVARSGGAGIDAEDARRISFDPGHRETFWVRNCVAVGVSAGFIEPLEASALALIELSAAMIRDQMPATREIMDIVSRRFNERFRYRWDRIIDFLKLHYVLTQREDSDYWIDNRRPESIPGRLLELLQLWRHQPPSRYDLYQAEEIFPSASYQYVLYGMGFRPDASPTAACGTTPADGAFQEVARLTRKMLNGLPANRDLIARIAEQRMQTV